MVTDHDAGPLRGRGVAQSDGIGANAAHDNVRTCASRDDIRPAQGRAVADDRSDRVHRSARRLDARGGTGDAGIVANDHIAAVAQGYPVKPGTTKNDVRAVTRNEGVVTVRRGQQGFHPDHDLVHVGRGKSDQRMIASQDVGPFATIQRIRASAADQNVISAARAQKISAAQQSAG